MWSILEGLIGLAVENWPADFKETARISLLSVYGEVWRRLVAFYMTWPWLLVPLADPRTPLEKKRKIANRLFDVPMESLDKGFSAKVRRLAGRAEAPTHC
jgi:hypothetical protein